MDERGTASEEPPAYAEDENAARTAGVEETAQNDAAQW